MAWFSWLLWRLTREQKDLSRAGVKATEAIERAYVDMSHKPPGLYCAEEKASEFGPNGNVAITVQITNHGATPANIVAAVITCHIGKELPETPPYTDWDGWGAFFLMPKEHFFVNRLIHTQITVEKFRLIQTGELKFWALGYVDYFDVFGRRHRAGYARRYTAKDRANNLSFETKPGYNYDADR